MLRLKPVAGHLGLVVIVAALLLFTGCGTLDLIGHARIHFGTFDLDPNDQSKSRYAVVAEVDGKPASVAPLPALAESGPFRPAWVRSGEHTFKIKVFPTRPLPDVPNSTKYLTFSAVVKSGTDYILVLVNGQLALREGDYRMFGRLHPHP